ncbi:MAG: DUF3696 domain-containing protein [Flavobacteriales bacterium]|nr:DUF3696 domain-containing protein [Flavobacteriales bacterium]
MALHSNYRVRWKNFKGFRDTGWIDIKPVTIVIGNNNSGKTSFIAPLLMMSQTVSSRDPFSTLILRGRTYDAGNIKEIFNDYSLAKEIYFGFDYHTHAKSAKKSAAVGNYAPGMIEATFKVADAKSRELLLNSESVYDIFRRPYFTLKRSGAKFEMTGPFKARLKAAERTAIGDSEPLNFMFSPNSFLSPPKTKKGGRDKSLAASQHSKSFSQFIRAVSFNYSVVSEILGNLSYIGPVRNEPKRYYELTNEKYPTVGNRGENLPDVLKNQHEKIRDDLNTWIQRFGFGDELEFLRVSSSLYSINFRTKKSPLYTNIANSGFGASQILPLLVQALVSPRDCLTIAEQPEIHLNPRLQGLLADLFCFMASKDQRVIVETHSEHLLLRMRSLIAEGRIKTGDVALYFVEKVDEASTIRKIEIGEDGHISSDQWPKGFFDESLSGAMNLAKAQLRRNTSKK